MSVHFDTHKIFHFFLLTSTVCALVVTAFFFASYVANNAGAQEIVQHFGYFGVLALAFIAGFNVIIPVPPATFVPIFTSAGLTFPFIILALIVGTLLADLVGYTVGILGKGFVSRHYPHTQRLIENVKGKHEKLLVPLVFLYTAFMPLPNEAFIIPLAMMGVRVRSLILPMIAGTAVYHILTVYGAQNLFAYFF